MNYKLRLGAVALVVLWPTRAWASLVPLTTLFSSRWRLEALAATVFLIGFEAFVIRLFLRHLTWKGALWRSALANAVSSAAAALIVGSTTLTGAGLIGCLLAIWMVVEVPLLWSTLPGRTERIGNVATLVLVANVASHVVLIPVAGVWGLFSFMWISRNPNHPELLSQTSGTLYAMSKSQLSALGAGQKQWVELPGCSQDHFRPWDVVGDTAVLHSSEDGSKSRVVRMPGCERVGEIDLRARVQAPASRVVALRLSPDARMIAALILPGPETPNDRPDGASRLVVFDTARGELVHEVPRWASRNGGIAWLPDGRGVLFQSFEEPAVSNEKKSRLATSLYEFNPSTGVISQFAQGTDPMPVLSRNTVLVRRAEGIIELGPQGQAKRTIVVKGLQELLAVSPDGRFVVAAVERSHLFGRLVVPVLVAVDDPAQQHTLPRDYRGPMAWVR